MNRYYLIELIIAFLLLFAAYPEVHSQQSDTSKVYKRLREVRVHSERLIRDSNTLQRSLNATDFVVAVGASAADLLRHIPGLDIDMDGNLKLNGTEQVAILIDGRPSVLLGESRGEMLIQLPADAIERITVNPQPSVSTLPDGGAGVINIILKKGRSFSPASFYAHFGNNKRYAAGVISRFSNEKWDVGGALDYKKEYRQRSFDNTIRNRVTGKEELQNNTAFARPQTAIARFDAEYHPLPKTKLGVEVSYWAQGFQRDGNVQKTTNGNVVKVLRDNVQRNDDARVAVYYKQLFEKNKGELNLDVSCRNEKYDENNTYSRRYPQPEIIQYRLFLDRNVEEYNASLAYAITVGRSHWDFGYQLRDLFSRFTNTKELNKQNEFVADPNSTYGINIRRHTETVYAQYSYRANGWLLKGGLRGEYECRRVDDNVLSPVNKTSLHLYPAVEINYNEKYVLAYSQRVNRPLTEQLNPFLNKTDITTPTQGNPHLKSEILDEILARVNYNHSIISLSPALFYRYRKNTLSTITDGNNIVRAVNLHDSHSVGIECVVDVNPLPWLKISFNGTLAYDQIDASNLALSRRKGDWWGQVQGVVSYVATPTTVFQLSANYISDILTPQGVMKSRYRSDIAVKQYFVKKRGTVTLSVNDWLGTVQEVTVIDTEKLYKETRKSRDMRRVTLGVSWNF